MVYKRQDCLLKSYLYYSTHVPPLQSYQWYFLHAMIAAIEDDDPMNSTIFFPPDQRYDYNLLS